MLALRNIICSDHWDQEWPKIAHRLRQQAAQRKKSRRHQQLHKIQTIPIPPPTPCTLKDLKPKASAKPVKKAPAQKSSKPRKPAPDHPWRRSPIGQARYQPSVSSKKNEPHPTDTFPLTFFEFMLSCFSEEMTL
jgi:hypothetical protein